MSRGYDYNRDLVPISSFEGEHWRTLQPYVDNSLALSPENKYLLCMSRLLTGNDTCSAIYKVSDGTYLVSNNTGDQSHYDRVVGALGNLATTGDIKATRRELESIFSHPTAAQVVTAARGVKGLAAFKAASVAPELTQQRYGGLEDDIGVIISGFEILGGRELVRSSRFVNDHGGKMHAEMRLLPQVIVDARTLPAPAVVSPTEHLMITSKLLCNPCNLVIESVNATCGINITTVGTHGKSYPGWKMPALDIPEGKEIERGVQVRLSTQHVAVMEVKREMAAKTLHDEGGFTIPRPTKDQKAEHSQTVLLSVGADRLDQDAPALFSAKGLRDFSKEVSAMQAPRPVQIRGATVAKRQTMASEPATLPAQRPQVLGEGSLLAAQRADVQAQYLHLRVGLEALPAPALSPTFQDNTHLHPKPEKGPAPHSPRGGPE